MFKQNHPNYFYTSDGIRIFYNTNFSTKELDPKRPVMVLIYGLLCSNHHYKFQIPFLEEAGYQILIHDYRFHYSSSQDGDIETCNFPNIAKDLHELLQVLNIKKSIFIGHSMGVNICLEHARRYPKDMIAQVLISGTVLPPQDIMFDSNLVDIFAPYLKDFTEKKPSLFKTIWKHAYKNPVVQYMIFDGGFNKKKVEMEFIQLYMKKISELPEALFFHLLKIMHDHDVINHLESIKAPTLVIGGDKDKIIPNYLQRILTDNIPSSELYIVKDGSHVPQADFPELINERILRFLQKTERN
ncbi:MAG: alpha/beta hydrolase [Bacteriovorax sp.]|jgi:non-heme chloroperoxidase|nr:alpha/beta hydrolase [Bacteriovorax sp.]